LRRIALGVSYNGSTYHGWQFQGASIPTIQGHVEAALSQIADEPIRVTCAGRTDSGVHATSQVVHFDTTAKRTSKAWTMGSNAILPDSISVVSATDVAADFDARFSAKARRYLYIIHNTRVRSALIPEMVTREHRHLDAKLMHESAQSLLGENDFSSFRAANCQSRTPMRNVHRLAVTRSDDLVLIDITANAFLHHMVRNIAGVLMDIGSGSKPVTWVTELLGLRDRTKGSKTAPPNGLYLVGVDYGDVAGPGVLTWPFFLTRI
jgi:tRNA pseudouridine38-40 synthase